MIVTLEGHLIRARAAVASPLALKVKAGVGGVAAITGQQADLKNPYIAAMEISCDLKVSRRH
jgi:hypothetical protein